jgi:exosortase K
VINRSFIEGEAGILYKVLKLLRLDKSGLTNIFFYMLTVCFVVWFKLYCSSAGNQELLLFIKPLAGTVSVFFGIPFAYRQDVGFYNDMAGIVIGKSCAGVNFYMILLLMLVFSFIPRFKNIIHKLSFFVVFFALSYIGTLFVNTSRVIGAIQVLQYLQTAGNKLDEELVHKAAGILCFSFFLMIIYYFGNRFIKERRTNYETPS